MVCVTWPGLCFCGSTSQSSFMPRPYFCGSDCAWRTDFSISCFDSEPRTPSARNTYLPISSIPGS